MCVLIKLVCNPLNVSPLKILVTGVLLSWDILTSRKKSDTIIPVSVEKFMFLCFFIDISKKKWFIKQNTKICNQLLWNLSGNLSDNYFNDNKGKY